MIKEIQARSLLRVAKITDTWFLGKYQISPYRGCQHACAYCDGRNENYYFEGNFDTDIEIKMNALTLLQKELSRIKEPGFIFLGSGITDAYQPVESKYEFTRKALEQIQPLALPLHVLTKSALIERDLPRFQQIAQKKQVIISFSIGNDAEETREIFEPQTARLADRWRILKQAKALGIRTGVLLLPVIPYISDSPAEIERIYQKAVVAKVDFLMPGGMTLKTGRQKDYFLQRIRDNYPPALAKIEQLYASNDRYGRATSSYYARIDQIFDQFSRQYKIPFRIPQELFHGAMPIYSEAAMLLAHIGDFLQAKGITRKAYGAAGYAIQKWAFEQKKKTGRRKDFHFSKIEADFRDSIASGTIKQLSGVGDVIFKMLTQFIDSGKISYYEQLRKNYSNF